MKTKNIKLLTLFTLLLMAGCTEDTLDEGRGQVPISLTATVECDSDAVYTRAGTGMLNSFANGDAIKVYFPSNVRVGSTTSASSTTYSYNGSSWSPATQPYFNAGASSCTVHAYYPSGHTNSTSSFSVQQDQSGDANYKSSDLMYATATITKSSPSGSLTFAHRMAKIIVNATAGAGVSTITDVRIIGGYRTINISTPLSCTLGTTLSNALSTSSYITMYSGGSSGSASCAAMIPPQSISGSFLQVVTNQGTATYSLPSSKSFESAKSYQLDLTVNATAVGTTSSISAWTGTGTVTVNPSLWTAAVSGTYTYSGSAIVPAAGNITVTPVGGGSAISSSKYSVYCENNTNAGTAKLLVYGKDEHFGKFAETTFTINKANITSYTAPTAKTGLAATGAVLQLINAGSCSQGTMYYKLGSGSWTSNASDITATDGGDYTVYWKITGDANHNDMAEASFNVNVNSHAGGLTLPANGSVGDIICSHGYAVAPTSGALACGGTKVAIIAYKGNGEADSRYNNGLAIALTDAHSGCNWRGSADGSCTYSDSNIGNVINNLRGIQYTDILVTPTCNGNHWHQAAREARYYNVSVPSGCSQWFLPTIGQWNLIVKGMCNSSTNLDFEEDNNTYKENVFSAKISAAGGTALDTGYWSSTEWDSEKVWGMSPYRRCAWAYKKTNNVAVRACLAF